MRYYAELSHFEGLQALCTMSILSPTQAPDPGCATLCTRDFPQQHSTTPNRSQEDIAVHRGEGTLCTTLSATEKPTTTTADATETDEKAVIAARERMFNSEHEVLTTSPSAQNVEGICTGTDCSKDDDQSHPQGCTTQPQQDKCRAQTDWLSNHRAKTDPVHRCKAKPKIRNPKESAASLQTKLSKGLNEWLNRAACVMFLDDKFLCTTTHESSTGEFKFKAQDEKERTEPGQ